MVFEWDTATVDESGPPPAVINGITAAGEQLVAVGSRGSKAATWVLRDGEWHAVPISSSGADEVITGITAFAERFVAVGASKTSDDWDAAAWWVALDGELTPIDDDFALPGDQVINKVRSVKDLGLIAVGKDEGDGAIWFSEDGENWTLEPDEEDVFGGTGMQAVSRVTLFTPKGSSTKMLIAVGFERNEFAEDGAIWIADHVHSWERVPTTVFGGDGNQRIVDVAADRDGGVVAAGYVESGDGGLDAAVWTSDDGVEWIPQPSDMLGGPGDQQINRLILPKSDDGLPLFIAAGSDTSDRTMDAALWYSFDGNTVRKQTSVGTRLGGEGDQEILSLIGQPPGIIAVGYDSRSEEQLAAIWFGSLG